MNKKIIKNILVLQMFSCLLIAQNNYKTSIDIIKNENSRIASITVLQGNDKIGTLKKELSEGSSIPTAIALNNGNLALLNSLEGEIELYNYSSELFFSHKFYTLPPYKEQSIKYSLNNKGVLLLVSEAQSNNLYLVNNSGELENLSDCENGLITGLNSTLNGESIFYSIANWSENNLNKKSVFLDLINYNEKTFSLGFERGVFNEQNNLFVGYDKTSAFCINYKNEEILWKKELDENQYFLDVNFSNEEVILVKVTSPKLENGQWIYDNAIIVEKNISGREKVLQSVNKSFRTMELITEDEKIELLIDSNVIVVK